MMMTNRIIQLHYTTTVAPEVMTPQHQQQNPGHSLEPFFFLTFIIGSEGKIYRHHAHTMVDHSDYIRSYLTASLMSGRKDPFAVYFPDIPPSVWDQMMKYLDPTKFLNVFEAASLREWYVRYGFEEGKRVCDRALYGPSSRY
jgi:hypothetical protein